MAETAVRKESPLAPMPLYLLDSDETEVFDFGGVIKSLNLSGVYVDTTIGNVKTFIDNMEALLQGNQDVAAGYPLTLTDDYRGTVKVKIAEFESIVEAGVPLITRWTLKLIQASTNA